MDARAAQTAKVNCAPLSEVITAGTPNLATQWWSKARAQAMAVVEVKGMASGHLVDLSTTVNR